MLKTGRRAARAWGVVPCHQQHNVRAQANNRVQHVSTQACFHQRHSVLISSVVVGGKRCARVHVTSGFADDADSQSSDWVETFTLGALFAGWYLANIYFNIYNKQVLQVFAYPMTLTLVQFAVGGVLASLFWATGLVKRPVVSADTFRTILPLAVVHTLGNLLTNVSLGAVAVSFTHTIKAMEPFFSVVLSAVFLGTKPRLPVVLSLLPIVGGVILVSFSEASFTWLGFLAAMGSNLTFQSRNVLSKKLMLSKGGLDNVNLFSIITIMSFAVLLPFTLVLEGFRLTPSSLSAIGILNPHEVLTKTLITGLTFHLYQQTSYMILSRVTPVTHSIGNCVKRVIVIVASVFVFQNPMSVQNVLGTVIALGGVFLYSHVTSKQKAAKAKLA